MTKHCNLCDSDKSINDFYKGLTYCKACHKKNREIYYIKNKESKIKYASEYRKLNIDKVRNTVNVYYKKRRQTDIEFRLRESLRARINSGLNRDLNGGEFGTSLELLGCSIQIWKNHLEQQFTSEMNWDNYGSYWEIDHIYPLSKGGSFHYTNTQPLTILENQTKSNKICQN
jgi:hypothetical protein